MSRMSTTLVNNCGWSGTDGYLVLGIYLYRPLEMRPVQRMELCRAQKVETTDMRVPYT
jgi:hypothetical protein